MNNEFIKLVITDHADPSVGIFSATFVIESPIIDKEETEDLHWFKNNILEVYKEYAQGRLTAMYDFEIKQFEESLKFEE